MARPVLFGPLLLALALPSLAQAQSAPCPNGPCLTRGRGGTHFLAEVNGGLTLGNSQGSSMGALVGIGGRLSPTPFRFYFITEVSFETVSEAPGTSQSFISDERNFRDVALGLRTYLPIYGPVRLFGDVMGGWSYVDTFLDQGQGAPLSQQRSHGLAQVAGGVQVRIMHHLSLGVRLKSVLTSYSLPEGTPEGDAETPRRFSLMAGLTGHF